MATMVHSTLRYPGGKSCLSELVTAILRHNELYRCQYLEPYAGGCGLALSLLFSGAVSDIHINDVDLGIWSFWKSVLDRTEELITLIESSSVDITQWRRQGSIYLEQVPDELTLGFSTFFLNRTNRSGVIKGAGVIGGLKQDGHYKIDCRFNKDELIRRIKRIAKYRARIHLTKLDALDFMKLPNSDTLGKRFFCIDPPYFNKGSSLYTSYYGAEEHEEVARVIGELSHPWIVTYDNTVEIHNLYRDWQRFVFSLNYSLQTKRLGSEVLIAPPALVMPRHLRSAGEPEGELPKLRLSSSYDRDLFTL